VTSITWRLVECGVVLRCAVSRPAYPAALPGDSAAAYLQGLGLAAPGAAVAPAAELVNYPAQSEPLLHIGHYGVPRRMAADLASQLACDEDLYRILNESLSGSAHGSVGSVSSGDNDEVARPRAIPFMLVSGSSVPRFLR
jgi:hypothetical protein